MTVRKRFDEYKAKQAESAKMRRSAKKAKETFLRQRNARYQRDFVARRAALTSPAPVNTPVVISNTLEALRAAAPIAAVPKTAPAKIEMQMTPTQQYNIAAAGRLSDIRNRTSEDITHVAKDALRCLLENASQGAKEVMELVAVDDS